MIKVCAQQVCSVFGELGGGVIQFMCKPRKFRISIHHMDVTAGELWRRKNEERTREKSEINKEKGFFVKWFFCGVIDMNKHPASMDGPVLTKSSEPRLA